MKYVSFLFISVFFFLLPALDLRAMPIDHGVGAVSSLHYHIQTLIECPEETILFTSEEVSHLWDQACTCTTLGPEIFEAHVNYLTAFENTHHDDAFKASCIQANSVLEKIWNRLVLPSDPVTFPEFFPKSISKESYPNFDDNPFLTDEMKVRIRPHLISRKHSAKKCLDGLFKGENPIRNSETFQLAGFKKVAKHSSQCTVAKHPCLGHYLAKLYMFDVFPNKQNLLSWQALCTRCESAAAIRALIKKHKIRYFTVPDKWVYALPTHILAHAAPEEYVHPILLVVENMDLIGQKKSAHAWLTKVTHRHLRELYVILSHGYGSAKLLQNIPYTTHHTFALIDTEYPKRMVDYAKVKRFITAEMQKYWDELVRQGGSSSMSST